MKDSSLLNDSIEDAPLLYRKPWREDGVLHGFSSRSLSVPANLLQFFESRYDVTEVFQIEAEHGDRILDESSFLGADDRVEGFRKLPHGDALLLPHQQLTGRALVVRSADCLPLLIRSGDYVGAVHAGWRGVALKLPSKAIQEIRERSGVSKVSVLIGPAICGKCYQVSREVIDAIGEGASYVPCPHERDRYRLSLVDTVLGELGNTPEEVHLLEVIVANVCTRCDHRWNSHRRGARSDERNRAWLVRA